MNRTLKIIFIILIALVIFATAVAAVIFSFGIGKVTTNSSVVNTSNPVSEEGLGGDITLTNVPTATSEEESATSEEEAKELALIFAERFGSFSNESNYENIVSLKGFMTSRMQAWADSYVESGRRTTDEDAPYYGITTTAIAADRANAATEKDSEEYTVSTTRHEVDLGKKTDRTFQQQLRVRLLLVDESWKVDEAVWLN